MTTQYGSITEAVINCLDNHPPLTFEEIAHCVPFSHRQISNTLGRLRQRGAIKLEGDKYHFLRRPRKTKGYTVGILPSIKEALEDAGHPLTTAEIQQKIPFPAKQVAKALYNNYRRGHLLRFGDNVASYRWGLAARSAGNNTLYGKLQEVGQKLLECAVMLDEITTEHADVLKADQKLAKVVEILDSL